ncbi:MAG: cytochrome C [Thermomicrobiales bacterium]
MTSMPAKPALQPLPMPIPTAGVSASTKRRAVEFFLMVIPAGMLLVSLLLPYWGITLHAPQYPKGLRIEAFAYQLSGDVSEVDGLNHYIGMMKLDTAAVFERQIALFAIPLIALVTVVSLGLRGVWRTLARLPIIIFPVVFVADLFAWLYYAGHNLDPHAALSSSIKPFTPHIVGVGMIGQFSTEAMFMSGFWLAAIAALLVLAATIWQWRTGDAAR